MLTQPVMESSPERSASPCFSVWPFALLTSDELVRTGGARLIIIDPIVVAVTGDMYKANDVARHRRAHSVRRAEPLLPLEG